MKSFAALAALLALLAVGSRAATIAELAANTPDLSTLLAAVQAAGFADELADPNVQLTVFAPTNEAFTALLTQLGATPEELLADRETLAAVLALHVVPGIYKSTDLSDGQVLQTLLPGGTLTVEVRDDGVYIKPTGGPAAKVVTADVAADNGVVHIINGVLIPGALTETPAAEVVVVAAPAVEEAVAIVAPAIEAVVQP